MNILKQEENNEDAIETSANNNLANMRRPSLGQSTESVAEGLSDDELKVRESIRSGALEQLLEALRRELANSSGMFRILEIGTAKGFSSITMARLSEQVEVLTMEKDTERADIAKNNIDNQGLASRITVVKGDAGDCLTELEESTFDFAFLDGAKGQYRRHFDELCRIVKTGGVICIDNVNFNRTEKRYKTINKRMASFREYLSELGAAVDLDSGFACYRKRLEDN